MRLFSDLWRGIRQHPLKMIQHVFVCFSVIFTILRAAKFFIPSITIEGRLTLTSTIAVSVIYGLWRIFRPSQIEIAISNCNTVIEVVFGDLFAQAGVRIIAVSEFFESELGKPVSERSVHGAFLTKCFPGGTESFDGQLERQLKQVVGVEVHEKSDGKTKRYPIGTTALVTVNRDRYLLFALTETDPATCKVSSNIGLMWDALIKLWRRARTEADGYPVNLPLVGSGLAGLGLPPRDLLNLIILSIVTETKMKEIAQQIRIILRPDKFDVLDLRKIKQYWENSGNGV